MGRFALLAALICLWAAPANAQLADTEILPIAQNRMLNNVVRVYHGDDPVGYGLIMGRSDDTLWVATPEHVVVADAQAIPLAPLDNLTVQVNGDPRRWPLTRDPVSAYAENEHLDLAFLAVRAPRTVFGPDLWRERTLDEDLEAGDRLRLSATSSAVGYTDWAGRVVSAPGGASLQIEQGQQGQSGAPVMTARGVVGLYLSSDGERAVPIAKVRAAAQRAGFPWALTPVAPKPFVVKLCLNATGASVDGLRVNSMSGAAKPDADGCFLTTSGPVAIVSVTAMKFCSPGAPNLPRQREMTLTIACRVFVSGFWSSEAAGMLEFKRAGEDRWTFSGLNLANYGWIRGTAVYFGERLRLTGDTQTGAALFGDLNVTDRKLSGQVLFDGAPVMIEVSR